MSGANQSPLVSSLREVLPRVLPEVLVQRRWFGGKSRPIRAIPVLDVVPISAGPLQAFFVLIEIEYVTGPADRYSLPLAVARDGVAPAERVASLGVPAHESGEIILHDALSDRRFQDFLLGAMGKQLSFSGGRGEICSVCTSALRTLWQPEKEQLEPALLRAEQSNTSIIYGRRLVFKLFRRLEHGLNPDVEIGVFLTEETRFRNVPPVAGYLEYRDADGGRTTLGLLQSYVANQGDAWQYTLKALGEFYDRVRSSSVPVDLPAGSALELAGQEVPSEVADRIGSYVGSAHLLGVRTAELHLALASARNDPEFVPEPLDQATQRDFAGRATEQLVRNFQLLKQQAGKLHGALGPRIREALAAEPSLRQRFRASGNLPVSAVRTRIHGDYHLGQVLFTGNDFFIIDFEGEPARSLAERRKKRSPLQDVAGMLRSFDYAAYAPLLSDASDAANVKNKLMLFAPWASYWKTWVCSAFLRGYFRTAGAAPFLPEGSRQLAVLLDVYVLDKVVYELGYELNHRPAWLSIPLNGLSGLMAQAA
jgi:maltose alpha-D-glucosyltransferase / alpha-amylase